MYFKDAGAPLNTKEVAKIFSSKEVNAIARGDFEFFFKVARGIYEFLDDVFSVSDVFQECYKILRSDYKLEYYIKNLIAEKILIGRYSLNTTTLLSEFRVGESKADSVILNGCSTCYEIKSEFDGLGRLSDQLNSYLRLFDKVNVVVGDGHLSKVERIIPESVGILMLSKRSGFTEIRPALQTAVSVDVGVLMSSLRRHEYLSLVKELYGEVPTVPNTRIYDECRIALEGADSEKLRRAFCKVLKVTRKIDRNYIEGLPVSLLAAGIEYRISAVDKAGLLENLNLHFSKETSCTTQFLRLNGTN
ncbi:sce7726 family protein [Pseudomonas sp. BR20]|uniref:sce7726 family protein n=1 Tax=Pseudomonas sp. BR20 TaxID=3137452 RepID=UPI003D6EFA69